MELITESVTKNWAIGTTPTTLNKIHENDVNIAIYERDITQLNKEIEQLLSQNIELRLNGDISSIINSISKAIDSNKYELITHDIEKQLTLFKEVTDAKTFRLLLATVNNNMCRRFHTDINDLRMLCTYHGPGTLWLTEENINRGALNSCGDNECIVIDENKVQQAKTGAIVILKGAVYSKNRIKAIVHRSPTIEESGETRLLLRIDTNEFLNF